MASVSVSHLILFIASLVIAASVAGTLVVNVDQISNAFADQSEATSEEIAADVTVISDTGSDAMYDTGTVTVLVKNTGSSTLVPHPDRIDLLIDGQYTSASAMNVSVVSAATDDWPPGAVIEITADHTLDDGDHRVTVRVPGDETTISFRVTSP